MIKLLSAILLSPTLRLTLPKIFCQIPWLYSLQLRIWIEKLQSLFKNRYRHQKNRKNDLCPDTDDPNAADDADDDVPNNTDNYDGSVNYLKHIYWENAINISKISLTPKDIFKNITDAPGGDVKIATDDHAADAPSNDDDDAGSTDSKIFPYWLRNHNHALNADDDYSDSLDDYAFPKYLINSKLRPKIDPSSMIKLKTLKTVT